MIWNYGKVWCFDLDSTLCHTGHRVGLINKEDQGATDWRAYSMACSDDGPGPALPLALAFQALGGQIVIASARDVCARENTLGWLEKFGIKAEHVILYDPDVFGTDYSNNKITHFELKAQMIKALDQICREDYGEGISLHIDDWPGIKPIIEKFTGIPVLIVHTNFEDVGYDYY